MVHFLPPIALSPLPDDMEIPPLIAIETLSIPCLPQPPPLLLPQLAHQAHLGWELAHLLPLDLRKGQRRKVAR
jgi:hypothetical protein